MESRKSMSKKPRKMYTVKSYPSSPKDVGLAIAKFIEEIGLDEVYIITYNDHIQILGEKPMRLIDVEILEKKMSLTEEDLKQMYDVNI